MTYLELVNDVLTRMREPTVTSVNQNTLSTLIGKFINDAKSQVEAAYSWNALMDDISITTNSTDYKYALSVNTKYKIDQILNLTKNIEVTNKPRAWMVKHQNLGNVVSAVPSYYCIDGSDASGNPLLSLYPKPDGVYSLKVFATNPQDSLSASADVLLVPSEPVVLGAFARALVERGEDGGLNSSEAYALYRTALSDAIAIESATVVEESEWVAV
jgi:hypothetical protein